MVSSMAISYNEEGIRHSLETGTLIYSYKKHIVMFYPEHYFVARCIRLMQKTDVYALISGCAGFQTIDSLSAMCIVVGV